MSTITLNDGTRTARKAYRCYYCDGVIAVGERHGYRSGVNCGDFWAMRHHAECAEAARDWDQDDYETFDPGTMERPTRVAPTCHPASRA